MRKILAFILLFALMVFPAASYIVERKFKTLLEKKAYEATGILYAVNPKTGKTQALCTIWNYAKVDDGYEAVTASHCASNEGEYPNGDLRFFVEYDDIVFKSEPQSLVPANLIAFSNYHSLTDVALFDVKTKEKLPVLNLADSDETQVGEDVLNVSSPNENFDKSIYFGYVTQNIVVSSDVNIDGMTHVVIPGVGPGSSGSAVLSADRKSVIGLVSLGEDVNAFLVPSNNIKQFIVEHPEKGAPRVVPSDHPVKVEQDDDDVPNG
jgi:hypothetical protein